jgi:hypothetical protein
MKTLKNIFVSILNIYSYGSLFLHELSHIIMIYLVGAKLYKIDITKEKNYDLEVLVYSDRFLSKIKTMLVAYSPILMIILIGVLAIFSNVFLILFLYTLTNLRSGLALPSKIDIDSVKNYDNNLKVFLEENDIIIATNN